MKILIVNNNMHIGGIQKSLVNLLKVVSKEHQITLFLFNPKGELLDDIPGNVKIINSNPFTEIMGLSSDEARKKGALTFIWRSLWTVFTRIFGIKYTYAILSRFQKTDEEYDVAISYMQNSGYRIFYGGCNEFVLNSVNAKKKIAFVHCDFKNYLGNNGYNRSLYKKFDKIACVSNGCRKTFSDVCPEYSYKTCTVHNFCDVSDIIAKGDEYLLQLESDTYNIFTCARVSREKGIMRVIPIIARLKSDGIRVNWYVAGDGEEMADAVKESDKLGAGVKFLGMLKNPYPYFKNADLLLVPSYNEAAPMVYAEAMCFKTPILTTDTTSAKELVEDFNAGEVTQNNDESIETALRKVITEKNTVSSGNPQILNTLAKEEFENCLR